MFKARFDRIAFLCVLIFSGIVIYKSIDTNANDKSPDKSNSSRKSIDDRPLTKAEVIRAYEEKKADNINSLLLTIIKSSFSTYKFRLDVDLKIKNYGKFDAKDIAIKCHYYSKTNAYLGNRGAIIYDWLPAGSTKIMRKVDVAVADNQAESVRCEVADFEYDLEAMKRRALNANGR